MGAVWRARDELLNRDVAVKEIIWPADMDSQQRETARRRAVREAQMAARLHHPNVVGVYDIIEEDGRPAIVMELLPFRSLRDIVRDQGPLPPAEVAGIGLGVLLGLRAAHEAGVVHRDVKPANILFGPGDRVVLTDFGIAKAVDSPTLTTSGLLIGSPSYTAPERARGQEAGAAADMWGLGASLYAAVEGRPPFDRPGALASLTAVVTDEPDPVRNAGPLEPVISGLLRKDPLTRLGAAEVEQMLRCVLEGNAAPPAAVVPGQLTVPVEPAMPAVPLSAPVAATKSTVTAPPARPASRRRVRGPWAALIAVLGIAVVAVAAALAVSRAGGGQSAQQPPPKTRPGSAASAPATASARSSPSAPASPSALVSPSAAPSGGASAVPSGYYRFANSTGFSIAVPNGWQIQHVGHYVYVRDPANAGIFLLIDQSDQPKSDPLADWEQQAAARQGTYPDYHLIRLAAVPYPQAEKAADWEFTYVRDGVQVEVLNRNVLANAQHAYALYWTTPVSD
ncbi:MAG: serine/threonine-protein kinase [Streptosporangiaceae bacterium]